MGLDLDCGEKSVRVSSYSGVRYVKLFLIDTIKKYVEKSLIIDEDDKKKLLRDIEICYTNYEYIDSINLIKYDLHGFECFINHSDCDGSINSCDATDFIKLCDKLDDYFDKDEYFLDDKFYLYDIFEYSSKTGYDIIFC